MKTYSIRSFQAVCACLVGVTAILAGASPAKAEDPAFISFGVGPSDWNRQKDRGTEFRVEYRSDSHLWRIKPFVAAAATTTSQGFIGAGVLLDLYLGERIVVTPSFGPHLYFGGNKKLDLDYPLEFRSQLEIAYRFDDRARLGVAVSHYSNASLGNTNPGTESATVYYSIPVDKIFGDQ